MIKEERQLWQNDSQRQRMLELARRLLPEEEKESAEDIVQEAQVRFLRYIAQTQIKNPDIYLRKIVQNLCNDLWREHGRPSDRNITPLDSKTYLEAEIQWDRSEDPSHPYEAQMNGDRLVVRLNDFPDVALYTLLVNDEEAADFDDWPALWRR